MTFAMLMLLIVMILLAGFYGGVETGAYTLSRLRLTMLLSRKDSRARLVNRMIASPSDTIAMTLVGHNLCVFAATAILTNALARTHPGHAELYATLILAPVLFVFAEAVPKQLFARAADVLFYKLIAPIWASRVILHPVTLLLRRLSRFWQSVLGGKPERATQFLLTPAHLTFLFSESKDTGRLSDYQTTLAENIMKLSKLPVEHAMIPLEKVSSFPKELAPAQFLERAKDHPYTRFPVYERDPANIVGVVNVIDLALDDRGDETLDSHLREPLALDHATTVLDALHAMREGSALLAVVTRDGLPAGIVTFKDLVEEIAGELAEW